MTHPVHVASDNASGHTLQSGMATLDLSALSPSPAAWGALEQRVARARIMAVLLAPTSPGRRARVEAKLELDAVRRAERRMGGDAPLVAAERARLSKSEDGLLKGGGLRYYRKKFFVHRDENHRPRELREIITAGLMVETMRRLHGDPAFTHGTSISRAYDYVCAKYRGNLVIYANMKDIKTAWSQRKPAAHLAAAFYIMLYRHEIGRVDAKSLTAWRKRMPEFLAYARAYEAFLLSPVRPGKKPLIGEDELVRLPPLDGLDAQLPAPEPLSPEEA